MKEYYKKENLEKVVKESFSYAEVLRKIGLVDVGSNFQTLKKYIVKYDLDISHFTGQLWNKGKTELDDPRVGTIPIEKIFSNELGIRASNLKDKLFKLGYKERKCEICGCNETWQGKKLTLELHHIDGNHYNNSLENLQILCPNCHSQTDSYRKRASIRKKKPEYEIIDKSKHICLYCGKEFHGKKNRKYCSSECSEKAHKNNIILFTKNELVELMIKHSTFTSIAKEKNVSRTTIKNYFKKYGLYEEFKKFHSLDSLHGKVVIQYDLNMQKIKEWGSVADAEENTKITTIDKCARFERRTAGGFIWRYK